MEIKPSSITSAKALSMLIGGFEYANQSWIYDFREVTKLDELSMKKHLNKQYQQYAEITKSWSKEKTQNGYVEYISLLRWSYMHHYNY